MQLNGIRRSRGIRTTIPSADGIRAGDLLNRQFRADEPNRVWVTDFTCVRTWAGWVYVVFIIDVFSRKIVAWHAATSKEVSLVTTPLRLALWQRAHDGHPVKDGELIHHSDAGSQYTSTRLTEKLSLEHVAASIGSVGDAYDNALIESVNGLYKTECIRTTIFHPGSYNHRRRRIRDRCVGPSVQLQQAALVDRTGTTQRVRVRFLRSPHHQGITHTGGGTKPGVIQVRCGLPAATEFEAATSTYGGTTGDS